MTLPRGWALAVFPDLVGPNGLISDGDWVESKDQDRNGSIRLTQLADIGDGYFKDKSRRFLRPDQAQRLGCTALRPNDVLVARMPDPLGRACLFPGVGQEAVTVVDACILRVNDADIVPRWLMYFINSPQFRAAIAGEQRGSTRKRISKKSLCELSLPVPPLAEQVRIADEADSQLSRLDAAIRSLERAHDRLRAYRASVLKAAVEGRLVATEAELARKEGRSYEPADLLLERILRERRRRWEEAELARMKLAGKTPKDDRWKNDYEEPSTPDTNELPPLPAGWCWTSLEQAFQVTVGATPSRSVPEYWGGTIPWVSSGEVAFCRITETRETITDIGLKNSSTKINPKGSVLVGMIGEGKTRGQTAILDIDACGNQNAAAIWVSETEVAPEYVYYYLMGQYERTRRRGSGNNQPALNKSRVGAIPVPLAPIQEQRRIVDALDLFLSLASHCEATILRDRRRIDRLRQSILKTAFEGRLVDQDPADESAEAFLARIRSERTEAAAAMPKTKRARQLKAAS